MVQNEDSDEDNCITITYKEWQYHLYKNIPTKDESELIEKLQKIKREGKIKKQ